MPLYIEESEDLVGCHGSLTHSLTDRLEKIGLLSSFLKYKSGALVTQYQKREAFLKSEKGGSTMMAEHGTRGNFLKVVFCKTIFVLTKIGVIKAKGYHCSSI